jgi:hypothetical protein
MPAARNKNISLIYRICRQEEQISCNFYLEIVRQGWWRIAPASVSASLCGDAA